jgi:hypothetical protein
MIVPETCKSRCFGFRFCLRFAAGPGGERLRKAANLNNQLVVEASVAFHRPENRFLDNQQFTSFRVCGPNAIPKGFGGYLQY